jgi:predicted nucleic acid-binding protein
MKVTILDTCCLINLYASQQPQRIIQAAFKEAIIPNQVAKEGLFIRQSSDDPKILVPMQINLDALIASSNIKVDGFEHNGELEQFVQLATVLEDGEAVCVAMASSRGFSLATDDRKAIAIAGVLNIDVLTTPEILMNWIKVSSPGPKEIAKVIENIERYGRFKPHHTSNHAKWWKDNGHI